MRAAWKHLRLSTCRRKTTWTPACTCNTWLAGTLSRAWWLHVPWWPRGWRTTLGTRYTATRPLTCRHPHGTFRSGRLSSGISRWVWISSLGCCYKPHSCRSVGSGRWPSWRLCQPRSGSGVDWEETSFSFLVVANLRLRPKKKRNSMFDEIIWQGK